MLYGSDLDKKTLQKVIDNINYNKQIQYYYYKFSKNPSIYFNSDKLQKKADRINFCNKIWVMDYYKKNNTKNFIKTSLCKDKFCSNCKKVKQAGRMAKYIPELEPYERNLYHLTLTIPNCSSDMLRLTIKKMSKCFTHLIKFLKCEKKIAGVNFENWGYLGAIRSLEVTFNNNSYHPHYHICLALENFNFQDNDRNIINDFSYSYGTLKRLFHPVEVLIQKIWFLLFNDITVNLKNINSIERGYSCILDHFGDGDYAELFKYMTKETKEDGRILTYDNFIALQFGLFRVKQIQGYGIFWNVTDEGDIEIIDSIFDEYIKKLREKENPVRCFSTPQDLLKDSSTIISRKSYFKYFLSALNDS